MAFPFTEDHDMIRETVRGFLQEWYDGGKGPEKIFQSGKAFDAEAWKTLAGELGMAGVAIEERGYYRNGRRGVCQSRVFDKDSFR